MSSSSSEPRPPPPPALQKSLSRRVSFNEATIKNGRPVRPPPSEYSIDTESQNSNHFGRRRGGCLSACSSCCACTSIIIAVLVTLILLLGGIFFAFVQSNLPEVRLHRLDVNELEVHGDKLSANFEVRLNATNDSGTTELGYRGMTATISSAGVELGNVQLADMHQQPHKTTDIRVRSVVKNMTVEEAAGKELLDDNEKRLLVIDVVVRGHMDFYFEGRRLNGLPFKIDCHSIDQSEIDNGRAPKCNTNLSPLS